MNLCNAYWGKTHVPKGSERPLYHLASLHNLDVAIVGKTWWELSPLIRKRFSDFSKLYDDHAKAWVLFFLAIHDLGKFDVRFQSKAPAAARILFPEFTETLIHDASHYYHGEFAYHWFHHDLRAKTHAEADNFSDVFEDPFDENFRETWEPWLKAVAGHHGEIPNEKLSDHKLLPLDNNAAKRDQDARWQFLKVCESLFLKPIGLNLDTSPPPCPLEFMAGFCSVSDWLGSMKEDREGNRYFSFVSEAPGDDDLQNYLQEREMIAKRLFAQIGLYRRPLSSGGMSRVYPEYTPRQIQTLINHLPRTQGLTLIEAPTGSGKTEAALSYAAHLLACGKAEKIIFALPTQATANAMLKRLDEIASKLFPQNDSGRYSNLVLAHGKARFQSNFKILIDAARDTTRHNQTLNNDRERESFAQCALWLSESRKRVFLGQIGVCTIDQVLISTLPVRHNFVRGFGIANSVLIIDEIHAYDAYMYGLIEAALSNQKKNGGSVILLSATLPHQQRQCLIDAWGGRTNDQSNIELTGSDQPPYPLITHLFFDQKPPLSFRLPDEEQEDLEKAGPQIAIHVCSTENMRLSDVLSREVIQKAKNGALVSIICNLVQDAQQVARELKDLTELAVDLFHSRFRFKDRFAKEEWLLDLYGKEDEKRAKGRILVATQVAEQSLDLDFDYMVSQLCPIDSLFQRLGRLHRHERGERPKECEEPACTVITIKQQDPDNPYYDLHQLIYGYDDAPNTQVLWRTEQILRHHSTHEEKLNFPSCYRPLIERVYQAELWDEEPDSVGFSADLFSIIRRAAHARAQSLTDQSRRAFLDTEELSSFLTRDGEMNLNILPVLERQGHYHFLDEHPDTAISKLDEFTQAEAINQHLIPVPAGWRRFLPNKQKDGIYYLPLEQNNESWVGPGKDCDFIYSQDRGLEKQ